MAADLKGFSAGWNDGTFRVKGPAEERPKIKLCSIVGEEMQARLFSLSRHHITQKGVMVLRFFSSTKAC